MERHFDERPAHQPVGKADEAVKQGELDDFAGRHGEKRADEELLDVLGALRRAVEREHAEGGGNGVHDADHRLLVDRSLGGARCGEEHGPGDGEGERVPVGGVALHRKTVKERHHDAERGHLGKREIDEHYAARKHMQAEPGVHAGQHQSGDERPGEELDHRLSRVAFSSKSAM